MTTSGTVCAFTCVLLVRGWNEMSFSWFRHRPAHPAMPAGQRTGLGLTEHWFMIVPVPATALWARGLRRHARQAAAAAGVPLQGAAVEQFGPLPYKASARWQKSG